MSRRKFLEKIYSIYSLREEEPFLFLLDKLGDAKEYSYLQLIHAAVSWREKYFSLSCSPGDKIFIILPHSFDLYASYLGAILGGMIPSMFSFPSPKHSKENYFQSVEILIKKADPKMIVAYPKLKKEFLESKSDFFVESLFAASFDLDERDSGFSLKGFEEGEGVSSVAFCQYSSGTTGMKKSVGIGYEMLLWQIESYQRTISLEGGSRIISWLPLYHDMGLIACFFLPILTGAPLIALSPFDWVCHPSSLLEAIEKYRATHCWQPNFAYHYLAKNVSPKRRYDLSGMKAFINCSEPVMHESHEIFLKRFESEGVKSKVLLSCYAMAENTFAVTSGIAYHKRVSKKMFLEKGIIKEAGPGEKESVLLSSGKALPSTKISVVDKEGKELPDGNIGEIVIKSPSLADGYLDRDKEGDKNFGFWGYKTGDLGFLDKGNLFVCGRKKDLIIIAGKNIYPQDVESIVNDVVGIVPGRSAALGVFNKETGTENLVVLAESKETCPSVLQKIREKVFQEIALHSEAAAYDVCLLPHKTLLKSSSGKIARSSNKEKYLKEYRFYKNASKSSRLTLEKKDLSLDEKIEKIIKKVAGKNKRNNSRSIHLNYPLISSGIIDSLQLVLLIVELEKTFSLKIPVDRQMSLDYFDTGKKISELISSLKRNDGKNKDSFYQSLDSSIRSSKTRNFLLKKGEIDTLIIGSSRLQGMNASLANRLGCKAYNFSVNSARTEDWYCLLHFVLSLQKKNLRQVFVGVDLEAFHPMYSPDYRLVENEHLNKYLDEEHMDCVREALIPDSVAKEDRVKFQEVFLKMRKRNVPHERKFYLDPETGDLAFSSRDLDSRLYNAREALKLPKEKIVPNDLRLQLSTFHSLCPHRIKYLMLFIKSCVERRIRMLFFYTPTHPFLENELMKQPLYARLRKCLDEAFYQLGIRGEALLDYSTPEKFLGDPDDFITDGTHIGAYNSDLLLCEIIRKSKIYR